MTPRYARNIFPPAHSGFAEEFESLEAEWEAMDGAEIKLGRLRSGGRKPAECVRYLEELRDCEAKLRARTRKRRTES